MQTLEAAQPKIQSQPGTQAVSTLPTSLSDAYRNKMGELLELTGPQKTRLKAWLKSRIKEWIDDTEELRQRLQDDNDLVEGVVMETDFPFEGASNVHVPVTEMYMEIYKSVEKRSILGADMIWIATTDDDDLKDMLPEIEDALNYHAIHKWNIKTALANVFWTTNRDGLGVIQLTWEEVYEKATDLILITNIQEFEQEFPSPEESGIPHEEFAAWAKAAANASDEEPLEIPISFEKEVYYGCKAEVVELTNFVTFPATVPDIKDRLCRGYGKEYMARAGSLRDDARNGMFYKDAVNALISKGAKAVIDPATQAKDDIEGLSRTNLKDQFRLFNLVIKGRLDGEEGEEGRYLVTYSYDHDELIQTMEYPYRVDMCALFRINSRPNRMIGRSIPNKTRDMNDEVDTQHNQRINARTIGTVPVFKAQMNQKKELDPYLRENKWAPGRIFWLTDFAAFEQFKVQPTDQGESLAEETNDMRILDLFLGSAASLLSGGAAPADPNAPGNKTAIMIQQSNLRMDDPLSELREGVSELGNICLSHWYQFGPPILSYQSKVSDGVRPTFETKSLHKKFLRKGIHIDMAGITVTMNSDAEMQKALQIHQVLLQEPLYAQNDELRMTGLRDALRAGRVANRERLLPSLDEIKQHQLDVQKQAMTQMAAEKQAADAQQAQEAMKSRIAQAKTDVQIPDLAKQIAERSMAEAGAPAVNGVGQ